MKEKSDRNVSFFFIGQKSNDHLHPDFVPSLFSFTKSPERRALKHKLERHGLTEATKQKRLANVHTAQAESKPVEVGESPQSSSSYLSWNKASLVAEIERLQKENAGMQEQRNADKDANEKQISALQLDNMSLREEIQQLKISLAVLSFDQSTLEKDDNKVSFLTGLPCYKLLMKVLALAEPFIQSHHNRKLSNFQELLMVLMRLRLNLSEQYLAYRFDIHQSSFCRILYKWILVLSKRLSSLIFWPGRDVLRKTMPTSFREHFSKCAVIIDCFEIYTERPQDLHARAQTWSQYKHHNSNMHEWTVKNYLF